MRRMMLLGINPAADSFSLAAQYFRLYPRYCRIVV
jgi:hypothetical protein